MSPDRDARVDRVASRQHRAIFVGRHAMIAAISPQFAHMAIAHEGGSPVVAHSAEQAASIREHA